MPRRNGTGPMGAGSMTGRGFGICTGLNAVKYGVGSGQGLACRCGFGRGFVADDTYSEAQRDLLQEQRDLLRNRLEVIDRKLENL